jgi:glycogen(starch) synthase
MILLASVLKPVDDTRMLGKFARALGELGAQVAVAGRASPTASAPPGGATLHPIFSGARLSLARLAAQGRYWRLLRQLRPALVIVHAPELLPLTLVWQWLGSRRQFIYDIRENYALNVTTQGIYQGAVRRGLAAGLRWVEGLAARRATALTLAEASYAAELPFLRHLPASRVVVLENKYQPAPGELLPTQPRALPTATEPLRLLYSGTISELNGLAEALALAEALHHHRPGGAELTVIGFCQQPALLAELLALVAQRPPWLRLVGGAQAVPHQAIVAEIARAHLGLALYRPHASTARCQPTKLFEYLAHGLPVLVPPNPAWQQLVQQYDAGLVFDGPLAPQVPGVASLLAELASHDAFYRRGLPTEVLWAAESKKLQHLLKSLLPSPTFATLSAQPRTP